MPSGPHDEPFRATRQHSDDAWGDPFPRGGAWPRFSEPARRAGRPFTRLSGLSHRGRGGRPLLHEMRLLGSRNALRTTETAETQKIGIWRPRPGDPPHDEAFWATRQHSTTRGEAPFQTGGLAQIFRAGQTGRKAIYQAVWPLPRRQGGQGGRPLLHEMLLLGSRNALRTTETAETQKIAIWRPRPGDPLTMRHFGPPDSIRRRVGRAPFQTGGLAQIFRAGQTGRKAIYHPVWPLPQRQGGEEEGPLLHEVLLLGSRNALRTTEHAETQKIAIWRARPGDPPHDEPFRAIRQHSTTRGHAPFKRGGTTPVKVRGG